MSATTGIIGILLLLAAGAGGWFALEGVNRRPAIGAFALFIWLAVMVLFIERPELFVQTIGGVNVVVPDVLCAFLALVAVLRWLRGFARVPPTLATPLIIFVAMLAVSYGRGLGVFGLQHATNEFREFFYFLAALGFVLSFPFEKLGAKLPFVGVFGGGLLVLVALIRLPMMGGFSLEARPVPSYAALAIGEAFFLGWFWLQLEPRPRIARWIVFGFLPFSFLMLHRSVWMALAGGLVAVLAWDRAGRGRLLKTLLIGGAIGGLGVVFIFGDEIVQGLNSAVTEATSSEESTFIWRLEGWQALLRPESGWNWVDLAIGRPMGSGYARTLGNSVVNAAEIESGVIPHNYYVSMLLRGGVVGLLAFLLLHLKLLKIIWRRTRHTVVSVYAPCFLTLLIMQAIYYVPYSADYIQGMLLGGAVMFAGTGDFSHEN